MQTPHAGLTALNSQRRTRQHQAPPLIRDRDVAVARRRHVLRRHDWRRAVGRVIRLRRGRAVVVRDARRGRRHVGGVIRGRRRRRRRRREPYTITVGEGLLTLASAA